MLSERQKRVKELVERYCSIEMRGKRTPEGMRLAMEAMNSAIPPGPVHVCSFKFSQAQDFLLEMGRRSRDALWVNSEECLRGLTNCHVIFLPQPNSDRLRRIKLEMTLRPKMVGWNIDDWR